MGYNTNYEGRIKITPKLHPDDRRFLKPIWTTRRMKLDVQKLAQDLNMDFKECQWRYGKEGQFVDTDNFDPDSVSIIEFNSPPEGQPSLWCDFEIADGGADGSENCSYIQWNGSEKTYCGQQWIKYLVDLLTEDRYQCNGKIRWRGEDFDDMGTIEVNNGIILIS